MYTLHDDYIQIIIVFSGKMSDIELQPFPVTRFTHHDTVYYYAYGNTPAEDLLETVVETKEPAVLLLGCGDIRSCFYTLWKNFDPQHKRHFRGVHFVLNDCSAAVLARNILFLYLCFQMPTRKDDFKKWVAALWSIWYCHELLPEHSRILRDALTNLTMCSGSTDSWSKDSDNPLRNIVNFASPNTLYEIHKIWKMWIQKTIDVEEMRAARKQEIRTQLDVDFNTKAGIDVMTCYSLLEQPKEKGKLKEEFVDYYHSGNAFAERVLNLAFSLSETAVNPTFFERADEIYSLHFESVPYKCFFQTFQFSPELLRKNDVSDSILDNLVVGDKFFSSHPMLANSVQQFAIWLSSSAKLLRQCSAQGLPSISFTFQCSDALEFCQQLHYDPSMCATRVGFDPAFDVIHSSNLIDHLAPPSLVLTSILLLKDHGILLTTTLLYKEVASTVEEYLEATFGFEPSLLPLLCGVRCIGHEGKYTSSISSQPVPWNVGNVSTFSSCARVLLWQQTNTPMRLASLDKTNYLLRALCNSIEKILTSYFICTHGRRTIWQLCTETVFQILLSFLSQMDTDIDIAGHRYWRCLCSLLHEQQQLKPFMVSLQTEALLHGFHFHLTVSESDCPICTGRPVSDYISQYSVLLDSLCSQQGETSSVNFVVFIHKLQSPSIAQLITLDSDVHIIDCLAGSEDDGKIKLDFFAPLTFVRYDYNITVGCFRNGVLPLLGMEAYSPTGVLHGKLADYTTAHHSYLITKVKCRAVASTSSFGHVVQHFGDGGEFESSVLISDVTFAALEQQKLIPKQLSNSEIAISCGNHSIAITFPHPIDYNAVKIKLSREKKTITVTAPHKVHSFISERPLYIVNPDNKLSLPPMPLSERLNFSFSGMQFTKEDNEIMKRYNRKAALMPTEVNLKESFNILFQCPDEKFVHLQLFDHGFHTVGKVEVLHKVHGLLLIHNRIFDIQNKTPAIDLSFCFLKMPFPYAVHVAPAWEEIASSSSIRTILMDEARYELLMKVFSCFASRTITSSPKGCGQDAILVEHNIDQYFTRVVIYPLYSDPDIYVERMGISNTIQEHLMQRFSGNAHQDKSSSAISSLQKSQNSKDGTNDTKCSYCGTQFDALKKCSRCGSTQYCGQGCQKKHWKEHKLICISQSSVHPNTQTLTTASVVQKPHVEGVTAMKEGGSKKCSFCGTRSYALKKCSRCGNDQYCGQDCQKKHWKEHKLICIPQSEAHPNTQTTTTGSVARSKQKLEGDAPMNESGKKKCSFCGTQSSDLKKCSRCGNDQYCGQSCQKKHWKEHKLICSLQSAGHPNTHPPATASVVRSQQKLEGDAALKEGGKKCSFCGTRSDDLRKCGRCGEAQYCRQSFQRKHWNEHKLICNPQIEANPHKSLPSASKTALTIDQNKCEGCEKVFSSLRKCQCHQVAYCSVECQRKDWQKHKDICTLCVATSLISIGWS